MIYFIYLNSLMVKQCSWTKTLHSVTTRKKILPSTGCSSHASKCFITETTQIDLMQLVNVVFGTEAATRVKSSQKLMRGWAEICSQRIKKDA